jgi:hypothetical protein
MRRLMLLAVLLGAFLVGCESEGGEPDLCPGTRTVAADSDSSCDNCRWLWTLQGPGLTEQAVCAHDMQGVDCLLAFNGGPPDGVVQAVQCEPEDDAGP